MLIYTMLTLDCKYSCVHLWMLKHVALHCSMYLSCVLMALVYIHNTTTWIHTWKQCVVFLQQTVTSKYSPSWCSLKIGADKYHKKPKIVLKCQTVVSLCTFSILICLPTSPYNSHKHLHTCTQPKSKLLDLLH